MMVRVPTRLALFTIEAREYQNFTFDAGSRELARNLILAVCIGIVLASLYAAYQRGVVGRVVRALLRAEALSPEKAMTLQELGLAKNPLYAFELSHNRALSTLVRAVESAEPSDHPAAEAEEGKEEKSDAQNAAKGEKTPAEAAESGVDGEEPPTRFYIPEELKYRAEVRYEAKGNGPVALLIVAAVALGLAFLLPRLVPGFLSILDNLMN